MRTQKKNVDLKFISITIESASALYFIGGAMVLHSYKLASSFLAPQLYYNRCRESIITFSSISSNISLTTFFSSILSNISLTTFFSSV